MRYAFIDAQNTETTTSKILGFVIDWKKLFLHLKDKWHCEKIFFYSGIQSGDGDIVLEYQKLEKLGYIIRAKPYYVYKNKDTLIKLNCPKCKTEISHKIAGGVKWKSNCDVELSVDAKNHSNKNAEFLIFTGDGDFEYLIRDVVGNGTKVYVVSSPKKLRLGPRYFVSRFSTKLRNLIAEKPEKVFFLDINDWKMRIKKNS